MSARACPSLMDSDVVPVSIQLLVKNVLGHLNWIYDKRVDTPGHIPTNQGGVGPQSGIGEHSPADLRSFGVWARIFQLLLKTSGKPFLGGP